MTEIYPYQKHILEAIARGDRLMVCFSRQRAPRLHPMIRDMLAVGTILASPDKWEKKQPDGGWKEIDRPAKAAPKIIIIDDLHTPTLET